MFWNLKKCFGISKNVLGSQKIIWYLKKCFGISKHVLGSHKMVDIVDTVDILIFDTVEIVDIVDNC